VVEIIKSLVFVYSYMFKKPPKKLQTTVRVLECTVKVLGYRRI